VGRRDPRRCWRWPRLKQIEKNLRNRFITGPDSPWNNTSYTAINKTRLYGLTPVEIKVHLNSLTNFKNGGTKAFNNAVRKRMASHFQ
jgi:hypothetical protein